MKIFVIFLLSLHLFAGIEDHYRRIDFKLGSSPVRNIDYIYLINLDMRPERWKECLSQFLPWGIIPERFPGIYGWTLSPEVLNDISLKFEHGMWTGRESVLHFPLDGRKEYLYLDGSCYGKAVFSSWTVIGTIGCTLSHLSILKDAYDSGYETVWILEDDIVVCKDPHMLSELIDELDSLANDWDLLYTDSERITVDPTKELKAELPMMWRPDMPFFNIEKLIQHEDVGENFMKIGGRIRAHSIIYRRRGIEKILKFYREHHNFLPYDTEVAMIPGIQMYILKKPVVKFKEVTSDTRIRYF